MDVGQVVKEVGPVGAVGLLTLIIAGRQARMFLDHLRTEREARDKERAAEREDRSAERESFVSTIKETSATHEAALSKQSQAIEGLIVHVQHCPTNGYQVPARQRKAAIKARGEGGK